MTRKYKKALPSLALFAGTVCSFSIISVRIMGMAAWLLFMTGLSLYNLVKEYGQIQRKDILTGSILSFLVLPDNAILSIVVFLAFLSAMTILHGTTNPIPFFSTDKANSKSQSCKTLFCLGIGIVLALVNVFLASGLTPSHPGWKLSYLFSALQAGIFEEICFRLFLFAWTMRLYGNRSFTYLDNFLIYIILILPHVLLHFPQTMDLMSILILSLLFGLPLSMMMRKVNLLSAMGAHTIIDLIRFIILGS
ncbi:CPBP family glutamic-type intramembrane protease [[Clostridium] innocuum]|nr:CAAX amino terminal protease family protein [Erysipelotrichaceae bacterium 3_1_53]MCR0346777.1 CPBP family glutamic-type intramembrane protease [[Clostridium] innocuum]